jgi:aryl-alcohol dehydrogenase-like predicted oxidoreductase
LLASEGNEGVVDFAEVGSSTLQVSKLGLGTMTFGAGEGFAGLRPKVDAALARELVAAAADHGVTVFDSSGHYNDGQAEEFLGQAVKTRRDRVTLSTKNLVLPVAAAGPVRAQIAASVEASLRRLGVDAIDLYQVGVTDLDQPLDEVALGLDDVVRRSLVRHVGVTNLPAWRIERLAARAERDGLAPIIAAQLSYSLLARDIEFEFESLLADRGIGVVAWSPLAGGFLTGKYTRQDPDGGDGRLAHFRLQPIDRERGYDVVDILNEISTTHRVTPAAVALSWAASKPFISTVVFGATTMDGLLANLEAADLGLLAEEAARLDEASKPVKPYPYWLYPMGDDR